MTPVKVNSTFCMVNDFAGGRSVTESSKLDKETSVHLCPEYMVLRPRKDLAIADEDKAKETGQWQQLLDIKSQVHIKSCALCPIYNVWEKPERKHKKIHLLRERAHKESHTMQMFKCSPSQMFQDMEQSPAMRSPKLNHETCKPPRKPWLSSLQKKERPSANQIHP